jgi:hypothetical protein
LPRIIFPGMRAGILKNLSRWSEISLNKSLPKKS